MDENGIGQIQPLSGLAILRVMMTPVQSEISPLPEFVVIRAIRVRQNSPNRKSKIQNRKSDITPCDGAVTPCVTP
jgi:hypothetical protein